MISGKHLYDESCSVPLRHHFNKVPLAPATGRMVGRDSSQLSAPSGIVSASERHLAQVKPLPEWPPFND